MATEKYLQTGIDLRTQTRREEVVSDGRYLFVLLLLLLLCTSGRLSEVVSTGHRFRATVKMGRS